MIKKKAVRRTVKKSNKKTSVSAKSKLKKTLEAKGLRLPHGYEVVLRKKVKRRKRNSP